MAIHHLTFLLILINLFVHFLHTPTQSSPSTVSFRRVGNIRRWLVLNGVVLSDR